MGDRDIRVRCGAEAEANKSALVPDMCDPAQLKANADTSDKKGEVVATVTKDFTASLRSGDLTNFQDAVNRLNVDLNTPENGRQFKQVVDALQEAAKKNGIDIALERNPADGEVTLKLRRAGSADMIQVRSESVIDMSRGSLSARTEASSSLLDAKSGQEKEGSAEKVFATWKGL